VGVSEPHLDDLERELQWFARVLDLRFNAYFAREPPAGAPRDLAELPPPEPGDYLSAYACLLRERPLELVERLALILALVPHLRPQLLDVFSVKNATFDRRFTEFGGVRVDDDFEPTGETLAFILGGGSLAARAAVARLLEPDQPLLRRDILRLGPCAARPIAAQVPAADRPRSAQPPPHRADPPARARPGVPGPAHRHRHDLGRPHPPA
jgi:hypothetical protein